MSTLHTALTNDEKISAMKEVLSGENVWVHCSKHMYFPQKLGIEGHSVSSPTQWTCPDCMFAWLLVYIGNQPPHMREQRLEEFEAAAHHMIEAVKRGETPFLPYRHPEIDIEHED